MVRSKLSALVLVTIFMGLSTGSAQVTQTKESKEHGWLGIGIKEVTSETVQQLRLPEESGAWIAVVYPATPAAKSGLKVDDVIVRLDSAKIEDTMQLIRKLREYPVGSRITVRILRNAQPINTTVVLGPKTIFPPEEKDEIRELITRKEHESFFTALLDLFLAFNNYQSPLGLVFAPPQDLSGLRITVVQKGTPARRAGLQAGDVITRVNGKLIYAHTVSPLFESKVDTITVRATRRGIQKDFLIPHPTPKIGDAELYRRFMELVQIGMEKVFGE